MYSAEVQPVSDTLRFLEERIMRLHSILCYALDGPGITGFAPILSEEQQTIVRNDLQLTVESWIGWIEYKNDMLKR